MRTNAKEENIFEMKTFRKIFRICAVCLFVFLRSCISFFIHSYIHRCGDVKHVELIEFGSDVAFEICNSWCSHSPIFPSSFSLSPNCARVIVFLLTEAFWNLSTGRVSGGFAPCESETIESANVSFNKYSQSFIANGAPILFIFICFVSFVFLFVDILWCVLCADKTMQINVKEFNCKSRTRCASFLFHLYTHLNKMYCFEFIWAEQRRAITPSNCGGCY